MRFVSQIVTEVRKREQAIEKVPLVWSFDEFVLLHTRDELPLPDLSGELFRIRTKRLFAWVPEPDFGPPVHKTVVWVPEPLSFGPPVYEIEEPVPPPIPEPPAPEILGPEPLPALPLGPKWHSHVRYQYHRLIAVLLSNNELWCLQCASSIPHVQLALEGGPKGKDLLIDKAMYKQMDHLSRWCELCLMDIK